MRATTLFGFRHFYRTEENHCDRHIASPARLKSIHRMLHAIDGSTCQAKRTVLVHARHADPVFWTLANFFKHNEKRYSTRRTSNTHGPYR